MLNNSRISAGKIRYKEDISPIEGLVNLVDLMLVFICGLLISIIMFWNVNIENLVIVLDQSHLRLIDDAEYITETIEVMDSYGDMGTVILDPKSGNIYVLDDKNAVLDMD